MPVDQEGITFKPIVWSTDGEVCGNYLSGSIRNFTGLFKWFISLENNVGERYAMAGLSTSLGAAQDAILEAVVILAGEPE